MLGDRPRIEPKRLSIEGDVKRHSSCGQHALASSVDPSRRRRRSWGRLPSRGVGWRALRPGFVGQGPPTWVLPCRTTLRGLGDLQAIGFSAAGREPSFHQGFFEPSLRWVLRRGMAYPWGLHYVGPRRIRMLTSDLISPPARVRIVRTSGPTDQRAGDTITDCCWARSVSGAYSFLSFHMRRTIAAIRRASVSLARFGLVPAAVNCR